MELELASSANEYFAQIVSGLGSGAVLFLIASGLTLIFGALRVVNFAHGALYMLGAYAAFEFGNAIGTGNVSFWAVLLLSGLAIALLGVVIEILVFRPIYGRTLLTQLLVTFALVLIIAGVQRKVWGAQGESTSGPPFLSGGVRMFGTQIPAYEFFFMGAAIVVAVALWLLLYRTELGRMIRAAVSDRELLALTGVNVRLLYTGVFALGCFFAGLAGALVTLQGGIGPDLAVDSIILAFVVIVLGGLGSLGGAFVASMLVGVAEALGIIWVPPASIAIVFAVLVIVLAVRPQGLFGARVAWTQERTGLAPPEAARAPARLAGLTELAQRFRRPAVAAGTTSRELWVIGLVGIVVVGLMPVIAGSSDVIRMQQALYLGLLALSLNLLVATTGLVSFGQAMFFAIGAYTVAVPFQQLHWNPLLSFLLTPVTGAVGAFVIGLVVLRGQALYFSLLTLGVGQLVWATAHGWQRILGGTNGITAVFGPDWLNPFTHPDNLYWFIYGCALLCTVMLFVVTKSPFGDALRGIRENRRRAEFSGLWTKRYELGSFVIAGLFGSISGGLFVIGETQITSEQVDWRRSALALIVCLIGGTRYFLGPFAGAIFYIFVFDWVIRKTVLYDAVLGLIVLGVALLMPAGLCGALEWLLARITALVAGLRRRPAAAPVEAEEEPEVIHLPEVEPVAAGTAARDPVPAEPLLAVRGISKRFGGLVAVDDVSFEVRPGRIHAIIGPNGAGKTTLFNVVTGLLRPSSGEVVLDGEDVTRRPPWQLVKRGVGRSFQQTNLFWTLSTLDNVTLSNAAARGLTRRIAGVYPSAVRQHARELLGRVGLDPFASMPANELSHGDQRSLELAAALAVDSRLLLLDEPTAGLSPAETQTAVRLIERIAREQGITVLFVEHDMEVVFGVADWITVLHRGAVLAEGSPEEIRRNPDVQTAYLGPEEEPAGDEVSTLA